MRTSNWQEIWPSTLPATKSSKRDALVGNRSFLSYRIIALHTRVTSPLTPSLPTLPAAISFSIVGTRKADCLRRSKGTNKQPNILILEWDRRARECLHTCYRSAIHARYLAPTSSPVSPPRGHVAFTWSTSITPMLSPRLLEISLSSCQENPFRRRICETFSADGDGSLTFDDFLHMMSVLCDSVSSKISANLRRTGPTGRHARNAPAHVNNSHYSQLSVKRTPSGPKLLSALQRCPLQREFRLPDTQT